MATPDTEHRAKIAEARNVLGEVIARARFGNEPTVLMNRGKEAAVIVGYDFYEQALRDAETLRLLHERAKEPAAKASADAKHKARILRETLWAVEA